MQWNWDHIRYFMALAEHGTLSEAARSIGVSHTTVQRRIKQFEVQIQARLFDHASNGYALTKVGETLFEEATKIQQSLSGLSRALQGADDELAGEVIITTTDTLAHSVLPPLIADLSTMYPDITCSIFMDTHLSNIDKREADIAIRTGNAPPDNLIGRKVANIHFGVAASEHYVAGIDLNQPLEDWHGYRFIALDASFSSAPFYQWFNRLMPISADKTTVNNFLCAAAMANAGLGITLLPAYIIPAYKNLVRLKTKTQVAANGVCVLSNSDLRDTEKVRVVRQYLYDKLPVVLAPTA